MIYFVLFFQQFLASMTHIVARDVTVSAPPDFVLFYRAASASFVFVVLLMIRARSWRIFAEIERKDIWRLAMIGVLNVPINQFLYLQGLHYTTAENGALLYALTPAMVFLLTLAVHRERASKMKVLGIIIAFVGVAILMFERGATLASDHTFGNLLIFIAVIAWSLFTMLGRPLVMKYGALPVTGLNIILGTLVYLPFALMSGSMQYTASATTHQWLMIGYLGIFSSVINYLLWFYALGRLETTKVAIFQNLQPVMTTILAILIFHLEITTQLAGGGLLAMIGVILVQFG